MRRSTRTDCRVPSFYAEGYFFAGWRRSLWLDANHARLGGGEGRARGSLAAGLLLGRGQCGDRDDHALAGPLRHVLAMDRRSAKWFTWSGSLRLPVADVSLHGARGRGRCRGDALLQIQLLFAISWRLLNRTTKCFGGRVILGTLAIHARAAALSIEHRVRRVAVPLPDGMIALVRCSGP